MVSIFLHFSLVEWLGDGEIEKKDGKREEKGGKYTSTMLSQWAKDRSMLPRYNQWEMKSKVVKKIYVIKLWMKHLHRSLGLIKIKINQRKKEKNVLI